MRHAALARLDVCQAGDGSRPALVAAQVDAPHLESMWR
jgi:hypothetical protein